MSHRFVSAPDGLDCSVISMELSCFTKIRFMLEGKVSGYFKFVEIKMKLIRSEYNALPKILDLLK